MSEEFTGTCVHTWRVRLQDGAKLVERVADLDDNAERLHAIPAEGLNR